MKYFQVSEDDLAELERTCPLLCEAAYSALAGYPPDGPRIRKLYGVVKRILSDVRWNYGPPLEVHEIHDDDSAG